MRRIIAGFSLLSATLFPALVRADDVPRCAGPVEIGGAIVTRMEQNGVLITTDGLAIRMEGIRLPNAKADRAPGTFTDQAFGTAIALTRARAITLTAVEPKEDRYDRLRAQVFAASTKDQVWVQKRLLELGLARVSISPDRTECAAELFAFEAKAREEHRGLWANPAYAIRSPNNVRGDAGTFQIVEGKIESARIKDGRAYLNFGTDWHSELTATVSPDDMKNFDATGVDPRSYAGKTVRVRGLVQQVNGPEIEIPNPQSVEVLN
ncbi:MAG TPA: thermonuclease family protein [Rhizomicrobium sp.]|jgi:endonuclease YncB( thermonuclease family)